MSFSDPMTTGDGELIRDRIHSENYVPDVSGWDIEKTGQAEFQDLKARGDLSGSTITIPAGAGPGQARLVIDGVNGISVYDAANNLLARIGFGASYMLTQLLQGIPSTVGVSRPGLTLQDSVLLSAGMKATSEVVGQLKLWAADLNTDGVAAYLLAADANGNKNPTANIRLYDGLFNGSVFRLSDDPIAGKTMYDRLITFGHPVSSGSTTGDIIYAKLHKDTLGNPTTDGFDRFRFGAGSDGGYYSEEFQIGARSQASGALTAIADATFPLTLIKSMDDYTASTEMNLNTGVWTAPDDGDYEFTFQVMYTAGVVGSRMGLYLLRNGNTSGNSFLVLETTDNSGRGRTSLSGTRWVNKGDTIQFLAIQSTGAAQTILSAGGTEKPSFIKIRRNL